MASAAHAPSQSLSPACAHVWLGGPEATGKSVLAHWIRREAQARGLRALLNDAHALTSDWSVTAAPWPGRGLTVTEWHDPALMRQQLGMATLAPQASPLLVLLCADDLPTTMKRSHTLAAWRDAAGGMQGGMQGARPGGSLDARQGAMAGPTHRVAADQPAWRPQVVMVYGQGAHRTASALRSLHFAWPGLWPLDAEEASALVQGRWRRSCLDCGTPSHEAG